VTHLVSQEGRNGEFVGSGGFAHGIPTKSEYDATKADVIYQKTSLAVSPGETMNLTYWKIYVIDPDVRTMLKLATSTI